MSMDLDLVMELKITDEMVERNRINDAQEFQDAEVDLVLFPSLIIFLETQRACKTPAARILQCKKTEIRKLAEIRSYWKC